ncbi:hypothetical protein [Ilumatobacter sp.]|uniref:hypothetical protein n=1 Tax=Ilumatobacter sp. TaxID=1967498 RepID=UPI003B52C658
MDIDTASPTTTTPSPTVGLGPAGRLRRILAVDALTSGLSGLAMAVAAGGVDDLLGTGRPGWVRGVGVGFVVFAAGVAWVARADESSLRRLSLDVVMANVAFVVAMVVGLALGWFSGVGIAIAVAVAVHVDVLAVQQWRERRRLA